MGGLAMSDNNLTPRIEQLAPELEKIISTSEPIQHLADGFGGAQGPAEGPLWWEEGGYLLFSDIHNNRRMKYQPGSGVSLFLEPTNRANGLTRDLQGRLVACEHDSRRVTRQEADGSITVVANSFQGRQLNWPNDVVVRSDGCIYFSDPWSSPAAPEQWDLQYSGVYRMTPDLGTLSLLADDFILPNGLAFSPDESVLYINDTRRGHIRAFELLPSPGARCDSESHCYFSKELEREWEWSERYPRQPEILRYLNHVADRFDLHRNIRFKARVTGAEYDAAANLWRVTTETSETMSARFLF